MYNLNKNNYVNKKAKGLLNRFVEKEKWELKTIAKRGVSI